MRKGALGLAVALIVGVALFSASGALATTNTQPAATNTRAAIKTNVTTRAAVVRYLRSIHVSAKGVVIQRGLRNYAGAHCPGTHWTCASTKHTVVQIAKAGGQNRFACARAKCAVVQLGAAFRRLKAAGLAFKAKPPPPPPGNAALCVKTTGVTQTCTINQPNATGTNKAVVWMDTGKLTGLTQSAVYTASITQGPSSATGSSNHNLACVHQAVSITGSTTSNAGVAVTNDAHQLITINQNSKTGNNTVQGAVNTSGVYDCDPVAAHPLTQDESLTSFVTSKGSITQKQDTATTGSANVVLDIEQNQGSGFKCTSATVCPSSGTNNAAFTQSSDMKAVANTPKGPVIQTQSSDVPNPPYSGIVGTINQDSSGTSTAHATQQETQCEDAVNVGSIPTTCDTVHTGDSVPTYSITQKQYGPLGVFTPPTKHSGRVHFAHKGYGQSGQTGNTGDRFFLTQNSKQDTDGGPNSTQKNIIVGDCTSGTDLGCEAGQTATLNNIGVDDGYTSPSISGLTINCSSSNSNCTATPPPTPTFVSGPSSPHSSASAAFNFTDPATGGVHFLCKIDGTPQTCSSGVAFFQGYGTHTFQVAAADNHGNVSTYVPATPYTWTNVPPDPTILTHPSNPATYGSSTFTFSDAESVHFWCQIDNNSATACGSGTSGSITYTGSNAVPSGQHTFSVTAYDATHTFASVNAATYTWVITPPDPSLTTSSEPGNPALFTDTGSFAFTDNDPTATFTCSLDGAAYSSCTSGSVSWGGLDSGAHSFSVKAYDSTGTYVSTHDDHYSWVITPPDPAITDGPGAQTASTDATFTFADDDPTALFKCNLDGAGYTDCPSSNPTYSDLSHGPHTLVVKATDSSGTYDSTGTAVYDWEVIPYLTFEVTPDGASAGWSDTPGSSPITLMTGSDPGTYAQFTIHDFNDVAPGDLAEPTFTTDTYSGGAPRYEIDFSNDDYVFGYPAQAGFGTESWQLVCVGGCVSGGFMSWGDVQTTETGLGATVTDALIDADFPVNATYNVSDFSYDGYQLSDFTG